MKNILVYLYYTLYFELSLCIFITLYYIYIFLDEFLTDTNT